MAIHETHLYFPSVLCLPVAISPSDCPSRMYNVGSGSDESAASRGYAALGAGTIHSTAFGKTIRAAHVSGARYMQTGIANNTFRLTIIGIRRNRNNRPIGRIARPMPLVSSHGKFPVRRHPDPRFRRRRRPIVLAQHDAGSIDPKHPRSILRNGINRPIGLSHHAAVPLAPSVEGGSDEGTFVPRRVDA